MFFLEFHSKNNVFKAVSPCFKKNKGNGTLV
jgi:hypothetical protein